MVACNLIGDFRDAGGSRHIGPFSAALIAARRLSTVRVGLSMRNTVKKNRLKVTH